MRVHNPFGKHGCYAARGFTLAELLIALTMSGLLAMAAVAALRAGLQIASGMEAAPPAETKARQILQMLSTELSGLYAPPLASGDPALQHIETDQGERRLTFFTTMPGWSRGIMVGRCSCITYTFKPSSETGGELVRQEQLVAGEEPIAEPVTETVMTGLDSFVVQLIDPAGEPFEADRDSFTALPRRIHLCIRIAEAGSESGSYTGEVYVPANTTLWSAESAESQAAS